MNETIVRPEWLSHEVWPHPREPVDTPAETILVVEDEASVRVHIVEILQSSDMIDPAGREAS